MSKQLGKVLQEIEKIKRRKGGRFVIVIPCEIFDEDYELRVDTSCDVAFIRNEEEEEFADCVLTGVSLAQEVVRAARNEKFNCSEEELVKALRFYLDRDAFMPMNEN